MNREELVQIMRVKLESGMSIYGREGCADEILAALAAEQPTADEGLVGELEQYIHSNTYIDLSMDKYVTYTDGLYKILSKYRPVPSLPAAKVEIDISGILPQKYKCPKCHAKFTRIYPYKPADTKEIKE